jgi:glycosyltransferase involved in cell wall biosynthesis
MKIGFDGKRAANNLTGLGNYSRSLITQLAKFFPQNQYLVYTPKVKDNPQIRTFFTLKNILAKLPSSSKLLWRTIGIKNQLLADNIDIYHGLSHEIPLGIKKTGIPSVVTIHDLIFLKFPQYFKLIDRLIYRLKSEYSCTHADKIIAISEQTKRDIISFFNVEEEKIQVVYQSCDESFKIQIQEEMGLVVKDKYDLPDQYILNVGTIETRKNLLTLIQALPSIPPAYKLIVVGKKTPYKELVLEEIQKLSLTNRVLFLQDVPFTDLPAIYQMASLFVYPSFYEGFGIPIIEALYSEVPVIAAIGSCLEEAGGPGSIYVEPHNVAALSQAINEVLENPELQQQMKQNGSQYVQRFNLDRIADEMMSVYEELYLSKIK